jgi:hypothetical protein
MQTLLDTQQTLSNTMVITMIAPWLFKGAFPRLAESTTRLTDTIANVAAVGVTSVIARSG